MITREILDAQFRLYQNGHEKAIVRHAKAKEEVREAERQLAAFAGGIDCCQNLMRILDQYEEAAEAGGTPDETDQSGDKGGRHATGE